MTECAFVGFAIDEVVLSLVLCGVACIEFLICAECGQVFWYPWYRGLGESLRSSIPLKKALKKGKQLITIWRDA
jgi:hypothetical protein